MIQDGHYPLHLAATNGHTEVVRCLCLAGCRIDVKNDQGVSAEIAALAQGHKDTSDLLKRLKRVRIPCIIYALKFVFFHYMID